MISFNSIADLIKLAEDNNTTISDIVKIINASDTLKSGYEKMRKKEYKVYTKTFKLCILSIVSPERKK